MVVAFAWVACSGSIIVQRNVSRSVEDLRALNRFSCLFAWDDFFTQAATAFVQETVRDARNDAVVDAVSTTPLFLLTSSIFFSFFFFPGR